MQYLIALIPALGWGFMPIITGKVGGSPVNQIFGLGLGSTIIGLAVFLIMRPHITAVAFLFSVFIGILWSTAQIGQFVSIKRMGVSSTIPLSTAFQLVGSSILGMVFFGDWPGIQQKIVGIIALIIVVIGVIMTSVSDDKESSNVTPQNILFLLITTIGYWAYSTFPNMSIVKNIDSAALIFPETLGILIGATVYTLIKEPSAFKQKEHWANTLGGLSWGAAAFAYIIAGRQLGTSTAFVFAQLNCIIATLGGVWILKEVKSHREMAYTILGIGLVVIGSLATGFIPALSNLI